MINPDVKNLPRRNYRINTTTENTVKTRTMDKAKALK